MSFLSTEAVTHSNEWSRREAVEFFSQRDSSLFVAEWNLLPLLNKIKLLKMGSQGELRDAGRDYYAFSPRSFSSPEPHLEFSLLPAGEVQTLILFS